ncbi:M6 family metalloprotease domain-containing protein, partial [Bacteroidota bacterium]
MTYTKTFIYRTLLLIIILTLGFSIYNAKAAYLKFVPSKITQPDGSVLECFLTGDEFYNWRHDKDGYTIIKNPNTRWFVYAVRSGDTLAATDYVLGKTNPVESGLQKWIKIASEIIKKRRDEHYHSVIKPGKKDNKKEKTQIDNTGTIKNVVIFIRFNDETEFTDNLSDYNTIFNAGSGNSMYAYFREVSYNTLTINSSFYPIPDGSIVESYQDSEDRSYYQPYDADDNPDGYQNSDQKEDREHTLLANAVEATSSEIPGSLVIDNDNDGYVDNVCFIVRGDKDSWSDLLWPHRWALYSQTVNINGKRVWDYNFQLQDFLKTYGNGVLAHEMFHTLGAPDLYHYNQDDMEPVGPWDIMASTSNVPQHMGAWMKYVYGEWISSIPEITSGGIYTLNPLTSSTNNCYWMASPNSTTQIFLFEYRRQNATFESGIPGSGLLVYRITPDSVPNGNRNGPPDEVYIYRPGGTTIAKGTPNTAHFSSDAGRTALNDGTDPTPFLADGSAGGLVVSNIGAAGTTISFTIGIGFSPPDLLYPDNTDGSIPINVTLIWNTVADADSYTVQVSTNSNFTGIIFNQTVVADTSVTVSPDLSYGTIYYWRVNSVGDETSDWSEVRSFTTLLEPPTLTIPANHDYGVLLRDTLNWLTVAGASYYSLEVSTQGDFTPTVIQQSSIGNTYYIIQQGILDNNTMYYWRVKAFKTSPVTESNWSESSDFTTILESPTLLAPANDYAGAGLSGILTWEATEGATAYNLQLSEVANFATTILNQNGLTNTSLAFGDLEYNTVYYWRIQAYNSNQSSLWSDANTFITILEPPDLASPGNNTASVQINARLFWHPVAGANSYGVQVSTDTNMSEIIIDEVDITGDTSFVCSGLDSKTKYFWRINAHNNDGRTSDWSLKWSYTTMLGSPTIPNPSDEAEDVPIEGMIVWNSVTGAEKYHVQFCLKDSFTDCILDDSTITATSAAYPALEADQTYYWRVRALTTQNSGNWSETWSFSTGLGTVQLMSPSKDARGIPVNGQLRWYEMAGAESYNIMLAADREFTTPVLNQSGITATSVAYSALQSNKMYYWRVNAANESGTSEWSQVWHFTTSAGEPQLLSPSDEEGGLPLSGSLNWRSAPGALTYTIQLSGSEDMSNLIVNLSNIADTFHVYTGLEYYSDYYWRVNASNNDGTSPWTETRKFTTLISVPELYAPDDNLSD